MTGSPADLWRAPPDWISVVMPTLNGSATIGEQLAALALQTFTGGWELVIADNGSTDDTVTIVEEWRDRIPNLRLTSITDARGVSHALNGGAAAAKGDFLVFCMQDDVVDSAWLEAMAEAAQTSDLVGGRVDNDLLNEPVVRSWRPPQPEDRLRTALGFLPFAVGANLGIWAEVFEQIGGWSEDFTYGGEDVDLSWRSQLATYRLGFAPGAVVHFRYRDDLVALWRQFRKFGMADTLLFKKFRVEGVQPTRVIGAVRFWIRALLEVPLLATSRSRRGRWVREVAYRFGRVRGSLRNRVLYV